VISSAARDRIRLAIDQLEEAFHKYDEQSSADVNDSYTAALAPGQSGWLSVVWTSDNTVTDWSTTVTAPAGITVAYPATRGGRDTSLYGSSTLVGTTRDFTAFKLAVPYTVTSDFTVTLTTTYVYDQGNGGSGQNLTTSATVTVPVRPASGPAFTQYTSTIPVKAGSDRFQQIWFLGGTTDLADFTVALGSLPAGLQVGYPSDKTSSALSGGTTLINIGRTTNVYCWTRHDWLLAIRAGGNRDCRAAGNRWIGSIAYLNGSRVSTRLSAGKIPSDIFTFTCDLATRDRPRIHQDLGTTCVGR